MKQTVVIGTNSLLRAAHRLMICGEISEEQYNQMEERNRTLTDEARFDIVHLSD